MCYNHRHTRSYDKKVSQSQVQAANIKPYFRPAYEELSIYFSLHEQMMPSGSLGYTTLSYLQIRCTDNIAIIHNYRLRVANLRQEMTDADPGVATDDSLSDIIRDFTHLASNDPDRLRRGTGADNPASTDL